MSEYPAAAAFRTPTVFSSDLETPFWDMGMANLSEVERQAYFADTQAVLDVGSGQEGIARYIYKTFSGTQDGPMVINLNPQFADWQYYSLNTKQYKSVGLLAAIKETMELYDEEFDGYFKTRIALGGLVQRLPFQNDVFDRVVSTWAFPTCLYDCGGSDKAHADGYAETLRVLKPDGIARLGPFRGHGQVQHAEEILSNLSTLVRFNYSFLPIGKAGNALELIPSSAE